jgi:hypothetical protein
MGIGGSVDPVPVESVEDAAQIEARQKEHALIRAKPNHSIVNGVPVILADNEWDKIQKEWADNDPASEAVKAQKALELVRQTHTFRNSNDAGARAFRALAAVTLRNVNQLRLKAGLPALKPEEFTAQLVDEIGKDVLT